MGFAKEAQTRITSFPTDIFSSTIRQTAADVARPKYLELRLCRHQLWTRSVRQRYWPSSWPHRRTRSGTKRKHSLALLLSIKSSRPQSEAWHGVCVYTDRPQCRI